VLSIVAGGSSANLLKLGNKPRGVEIPGRRQFLLPAWSSRGAVVVVAFPRLLSSARY
jgi:hypothetical protein